MIFRFIAWLFWVTITAIPSAYAENCEMAARLTREVESLPLTERLTAYQAARAHCPSDPKSHYREAMALMDSAKYPQAEAAFKAALDGVTRQSASPAMRLEILGRLAENDYRRGDRPRALAHFKIAREFASTRQLPLPAWIPPLQMDLDKQLDNQPLSASEMQASLKGMRDLGVEPTVDYRVLFDTGSDRLTVEAEQQMRKVADSLNGDWSNIQVIGHTDQRGTKEYNQKLSERRALRIVNWLAGYNPSFSGHLSALGKGMTEPKYSGNSDEDYQMNRRVEFVFSRN
jgi:outer membrane protein OmpA-like peptidoglycan-associated protein